MAIHELHDELVRLKICEKDSLVPFHPRLSDRDDISALQCAISDVILLSRIDHLDDPSYFPKKERDLHLEDLGLPERSDEDRDTTRRMHAIKGWVDGSCWLDVGTGEGALLEALKASAKSAEAIEPNVRTRTELVSRGHLVYPSAGDAPAAHYDLITLFHVLEHFPNPLDELKSLRRLLKSGGRIIIEVPHAKDFLLGFLKLDSFKDFTLWSQHLLLHTRQSLTRFLEASGYRDIEVTGIQRHPLANHLYWLAKGRPGGHDHWSELLNNELDSAYTALLVDLDATDTLVAEAVAPEWQP